MDAQRRMELLVSAYAEYTEDVSEHYDEVVDDVIARVEQERCLSKLDIAALTGWKRLQANTLWMKRLMSTSDDRVRAVTREVVTLARDESQDTPTCAKGARTALSQLDGFRTGDALASTVCYAAAPRRLAVFDRRALVGLDRVDLEVTGRRGRYASYIAQIERCRHDLADFGHTWTARQVDLALYQLGGQQADPSAP